MTQSIDATLYPKWAHKFSRSIKKDANFGVKQEWVSKVSKTNSQGPKVIYVLKPKV